MSWTDDVRKMRRRHIPAPLVVDAPTLLDGIGAIAQLAQLWGEFTGRIPATTTTEEVAT